MWPLKHSKLGVQFVCFSLCFALFNAFGCADLLGYGDYAFDTHAGGQAGSSNSGGAGGTSAGGGGGLPNNNECKSDVDCNGSPFGEVCDGAKNQCVECLPLPNKNTCALGLYCDVAKICVIGCAIDADCNPQGVGPLSCNGETHQCEQCSENAPCPLGSKCKLETGVCASGCDNNGECPTSDYACCLKQCKNVTKDVQNCGACEDICLPDQSTTWLCLDGGCVFQSCTNNFADCDQNFGKGNGCETDIGNDPSHCGSCSDECNLPNAVNGCNNGLCVIESCGSGFGNCDGSAQNGCETNLNSNVDHCGSCGASCPDLLNGVSGCNLGECVLVGCNTGSGNCDGNEENGCETNTEVTAEHCGQCGNACALPSALATCNGGKCEVLSCDAPFDDCNNVDSDGCEVNLTNNANHCGVCGLKCSFSKAKAECAGSECVIGVCDVGFANCDGIPSNGCEKDVNVDASNCGACGVVCGNQNSNSSCILGQCQLQCAMGFADCDGLSSNGCEVNTQTSVQNCNGCGQMCPTGGGTPYCSMSACGVSNCSAGTANCDGDPATGPGGCETNTTTAQNCGACGNTCSATNGTPSCNGATCSIGCNDGFGNCNNLASDGCEVALNTNNNCTGCGVVCSRPHAITSCGTGSCQIVTCDAGWANCNGNSSDGCESNIALDENNCGGCGDLCAPPNAVGECTNGVCGIASCNGSFANCNGSTTDGCEIDKATNLLNCGTCGAQCSLPNAVPVCNGGQCEISSCQGSFVNCDAIHANGCEANTASSINNCGSCGNVCSNINGSSGCVGGSCNITCNGGFGNCDNNFSNGCEASLNTLTNCGACGAACNLPHASESCATGTCQITSCDSAYTNCNLMTADGCECSGSCVSGTCQGCGDGTCSSTENCASCPADCPCFCGDAVCSGSETCMNCPADCGSC